MVLQIELALGLDSGLGPHRPCGGRPWVLVIRNAPLMASVAMPALIVLLSIRSGVVGRELISPSEPLNLDLPAPLNSVESKINGKPGMNRLDWNNSSPLSFEST